MQFKELKKEENTIIPDKLIKSVCVHNSEFIVSNPNMEIGVFQENFDELFKSNQEDFVEHLRQTTISKTYNTNGKKTQHFWMVDSGLLLSWGSAYPEPDKVYYLCNREGVEDKDKLINHMTDDDINYVIRKQSFKNTKWLRLVNIIMLITSIYLLIVNPEEQQTLILAILLFAFGVHLYITNWEMFLKNKFNK